jgi:ABC-2 type transport system ATP-binding protein
MTERDVVTVRDLRKTYGQRVVVDGLNFEVRAGEIVGLAGANGAGKTTTVECIQGLRRPDSGTLSVLGYDPVTQAAQVRPLIGSQLQDSALPDRLRVGEAVELFAAARATGAARATRAARATGAARGARGADLLEQFGLAQRRRSPFGGLSGGERQRLFLVLALLNQPRLVILDELTQGLDPAARRGVWDAVRQLHAGGATVLLVTHEMTEAEALCDRIVVMRAGRVLDTGTPAELVARHAGWASVSFSWPDPPADLLAELGRLDAVAEVRRTGARITVDGARPVIAHVGAALVRRGRVPEDLSVHVPDLDDAMLTLLQTGPGQTGAAKTGAAKTGAAKTGAVSNETCESPELVSGGRR